MVAGKIKVEKTISFKHKQEVFETRWTELIKRQRCHVTETNQLISKPNQYDGSMTNEIEEISF